VRDERSLLVEILSRRDPGLVEAIERLEGGPVPGSERERIKRAVVDELCELPQSDGRRALALEELLIRLGAPR
jgi:hypothetical protein